MIRGASQGHSISSPAVVLCVALCVGAASPIAALDELPLVPLVPPKGERSKDLTKGPVVLHPLRGLGLEEEELRRLELTIRRELHGLPDVSLVEMEEVLAYLETKESGCGGDDSCLASLGDHLGARVVLDGVVSALGDAHVVSLKVVSTTDATVIGRVERRAGGEAEALIPAFRSAVYELLRPDLFVGKLMVQVPVEGAEVFVDGEAVATTPLDGPIEDVKPGRRSLRVVVDGHDDLESLVDVRFQRTLHLRVDLSSRTIEEVSRELKEDDGVPRVEELSPQPAIADAPAPQGPSSWGLTLWAGVCRPFDSSHPFGMAAGAGLDRPLSSRHGLRLRIRAGWANHKVDGPRVIQGRGLDGGFVQASNYSLLEGGVEWHPARADLGASGFFFGNVGASLVVTDRRLFSAEDRGARVIPTAVIGAGLDVSLGPADLRMELGIRAVETVIGPEDSPVSRSPAAMELTIAYRLFL